MGVSNQSYFAKAKDCLTQYWLDAKEGRAKPFKHYRELFKLNAFWSEKLVSQVLNSNEPPTDDIVLSLINTIREYRLSGKKQNSNTPQSQIPKLIPNRKATDGNPELAKFHARELIEELEKRGYTGELQYVYKISLRPNR